MKSGRNLLIVLAVTGFAGSALADQVHMSHPGNAYRDPSFSGGAFRATQVNGYIGQTGGFGGTNNSFLTFCLERDEYVAMGSTYYTTISTVARDGGSGGPSPDPLSPVTAALYVEFRNGGTFGSVALGNGMLDTASEIRSLQRAIWHAEEENLGTEYTNDALAVALYTWAVNNNTGSIGDVRVLNLWTNPDGTGHAQDQLTIIPLPPAAWAGLASLAGVVGMGHIRRRNHRA